MIFAIDADPYVMLVASLPAIGLLSEKAPPINRDRLAERLRQLSPEHLAEIETLRTILSWDQIDTGNDDAAFVARAERLLENLRNEDIRAAVRDRLEIRTLVAALRRRHVGEEAPPPGEVRGFGRYLAQIRANWGAPDFGLARSFPWVLAAKDKLETGDAAGLERLLLDAAWDAIARRELGHTFDFEAVAFYVGRWHLADRWSRYDADAAAARFAQLLDAALSAGTEMQDAA